LIKGGGGRERLHSMASAPDMMSTTSASCKGLPVGDSLGKEKKKWEGRVYQCQALLIAPVPHFSGVVFAPLEIESFLFRRLFRISVSGGGIRSFGYLS